MEKGQPDMTLVIEWPFVLNMVCADFMNQDTLKQKCGYDFESGFHIPKKTSAYHAN